MEDRLASASQAFKQRYSTTLQRLADCETVPSWPIPFSPMMVEAIFGDLKTQTRRAMRPQPNEDSSAVPDEKVYQCPYGAIGDRLWVREQHYRFGHWEPIVGAKTKSNQQKWQFVADSDEVLFDAPPVFAKGLRRAEAVTPKWYRRLARFMPRRFSRLTLEITDLRIERLLEISDTDVEAEGFRDLEDCPYSCPDCKGNGAVYVPPDGSRDCKYPCWTAKGAFLSLWDHLNGPGSSAANPWVWCVSFKRVFS